MVKYATCVDFVVNVSVFCIYFHGVDDVVDVPVQVGLGPLLNSSFELSPILHFVTRVYSWDG